MVSGEYLMPKFDPIEKIKAKEFLNENGWKDLLDVAEQKKLQDKVNKASKKSIKSHAEKLSENES